ncbi:unnamed protein product [Bathycoccus prasinos]
MNLSPEASVSPMKSLKIMDLTQHWAGSCYLKEIHRLILRKNGIMNLQKKMRLEIFSTPRLFTKYLIH